jgi:hypothetical protein
MSKFVLKKAIALDQFGQEWEGCSITFNSPTYGQIRDLNASTLNTDDLEKINAAISLLHALFIDGTGYNGESVVAMEASDLAGLPLAILTYLFLELAGQASPKDSES